MLVTDLRSCWQNHYVGNFFSLCWWFCKCIKLTDLNLSQTNFFSNIRHQHRFQPKISLREVLIRDRREPMNAREPSGRSRLFPKIMFPVLKKIPAETFPRRFPASWFPLISGVIFQQVIWLGMAVPLILISILRWWVRLMYFSNLIIYSKMEYWCSKKITSRSQNQPRSHFENDWSFSPGCIFRLNFKIQITVRLRGVQWL